MAATTLRLLSYNIQAGIGAGRYRDYLTGSWRHVLPDRRTLANLDAIARLLRRYDLVGLQEVDGGSLRSAFLDQARYLAHR
ncbi:MAG TPA: endonuclease, partial [Chromatiales bacterium]|nr:endonuclease [Chromatiales bacterium]